MTAPTSGTPPSLPAAPAGVAALRRVPDPLPPAGDPAERLAAAVTACPGVAGLSGGAGGQIASYLPGRQVTGVRTRPGSDTVNVTARYGHLLHAVAASVCGAAAAVGGAGSTIDVAIDDIQSPDEAAAAAPGAADPGPPPL